MNKFIYGIHPVKSFIKKNPELILKAYILKNKKKLKNIVFILKKKNILIKTVSKEWMKLKTRNSVHQGILIYICKSKQKIQKKILLKILNKNNPLILILDRITDTRNFGACIRCAESFGVDIIIVPKNKSAKLNEIAKKSASGSNEFINIIKVSNISRIIEFLKENNIKIIGTDYNAKKNIFQKNLNIPLALIIGSESNGIKYMIKNKCNDIVKIPMIGHTKSLNVSVACGIILFETIRQRFFLKN